jgi:hypothetical protein
MRALLGKLSRLLCALIATGAAAQVVAPKAAKFNHVKETKFSYLQPVSVGWRCVGVRPSRLQAISIPSSALSNA